MHGCVEEDGSPESSVGDERGAQNRYDPDYPNRGLEYDDLQVQCPSHTTQRRLISKVDLRVIPVLSLLYLLAFLDRTNIANAAVFGLQKDLNLTGKFHRNAVWLSPVDCKEGENI